MISTGTGHEAWDPINDPAVSQDATGWFRRHRGHCPAFHSEQHGGFWVLPGYADQLEVFRRNDVFSTSILMIPPPAYTQKWIPGQIDPPEHRRYRRALMPLFEPADIDPMEDGIRAVCRELLAPLTSRRGCEFIAAYAGPLPSIVFAKLIGVPDGEIGYFRDLSLKMIGTDTGDQLAADHAMREYIQSTIRGRTAAGEPGDDWVGHVLRGDRDGQQFTEDEQVNMVQFLFLAGLITTTALLSVCFYELANRPAERAALRAAEGISSRALEELLRISGRISLCRAVREDVVVGAAPLRAGDVVMLPLMAANRDPAEFTDPDAVDFERTPNRHVTFGYSIHRCIGAGLARLEVKCALEEWHRAIPDYRVAGDVEWVGGVNNRPVDLNLAW